MEEYVDLCDNEIEDDGRIASEENDEESEDGVNKPATYNML